MIKIYSGEKIIYLTNDQTPFRPSDSAIMATVGSADEMRLLYDELLNKKLDEIWFYHHNLDTLYEYFCGLFKIVSAAGGLVRNKNGNWLFIFRNGKWDLPKGKIEKNEGKKEAAVREVEEECGISGLIVIRKLPETHHIYEINDKKILKPTYWYEMECSDDSALVPQTEEGITDVRWIASADLAGVKENTFGSILDVMMSIEIN
ncbi:MAG: NUDIX domain-containing protein [Bacteroidota bacterium]|nr:NUDIX domain-containing protein [Bacteroidota bacterium]